MTGSALATSLLGRRIRLTTAAGEQKTEGQIVTVYLDAAGLHFLVLVAGRLKEVTAEQFTVLDILD
jgi:hypothetical protein